MKIHKFDLPSLIEIGTDTAHHFYEVERRVNKQARFQWKFLTKGKNKKNCLKFKSSQKRKDPDEKISNFQGISRLFFVFFCKVVLKKSSF